ncbi:PREDICTED: platelet glycoprotein IX-like, partial [Nanorana parkeri]|uniref:platelet glycoprotein IX-like n=1 Tax=Nanorana parkeri TaxID=125878 RepID=UPI0008547F72
MLVCPKLILLGLWFLTATYGGDCPVKCKCSNLDKGALKVDCSFGNLDSLQSFPEETEELLLQENKLTTIPAGAFDNLVNVKKFNLTSNPLHCDCNIWYLIMWLSDGDMEVDSGMKCVSPTSMYGKPLSQLVGNQIASCSRHKRLCSDFLFNDAFLYILLFLLLFLMILCLKTFKKIKFKIKISDSTTDSRLHRYSRVNFLKRRRSYSYWKHRLKSALHRLR